MLVTINDNGGRKSSGGNLAQEYLLGDDEPRENARLLKGDPDATTEVINGLNFAKIYTSGTLAFAYNEGDKLSDQDKFDIIEKFENSLFPNIPIEQISGYWVEHTDKVLRDEKTDEPILDANGKEQKRLELNFIYANVELTTGKALPIYYHDNDVHLTSAFRDVINAEYDLIDPNAINHRQSLSIPKNLPKQKKAILESAHDLVCAELSLGNINDRNDILKVLTDAGIAIASKPTHKYISLQDPEGGQNIRMKGELYEREFTIEKFISEHNSSEATQHGYSDADIAAARERLQYSIGKRADRLESRFFTSEPRAYPVLQSRKSADIRELIDFDDFDIAIDLELDGYIREPKQEIRPNFEIVSGAIINVPELREPAHRHAGAEIHRSTRNAGREQQSLFEAAQNANTVANASHDSPFHHSLIEHDWSVDPSKSFGKVEKSQPNFGLDSFFSNSNLWHLGVDRTKQKREQLDDNANSGAAYKKEHDGDRATAQSSSEKANDRNDARFSTAQIDFGGIAYSVDQFVTTTSRAVAEVQHYSGRDKENERYREATSSDSKRAASSSSTTRNFITNIIAIEDGTGEFHTINEKIRLAIERQEQAKQELEAQQSDIEITPVFEVKPEMSKPIASREIDDSYDFSM